MSNRACTSCGAVNTGAKVYCFQCGAVLAAMQPGEEAESLSPAASVAMRRSVRIKADEPLEHSSSALNRGLKSLLGLLLYALTVAIGVAVVLALMEPKGQFPQSQGIPNARAVARRIISSSRYAPAILSQQLINSCLAEQGPVKWEAPIKSVAIPVLVLETAHVEIGTGKLTVSSALILPKRPLHFSESFRLEGGVGVWRLVPESASIGLLDLPEALLSIFTPIVLACISPFASDLSILASSQSLVIRPEMIEFTTH